MQPWLLEDSISLSLTLAAGMILVYLGTFMGELLIIPLALLFLGLVFQIYISQKIPHDEETSPKELKQVALWVVVCVAAFGLVAMSENLVIPILGSVELSVVDAKLYTVLYAISEERFFRGALTLFAYWKTNNIGVAAASSGIVFGAIYHQAIYGSNIEKIIYVVLLGTVLGYVTLKTKRLSPAILSHCINNLLAVS